MIQESTLVNAVQGTGESVDFTGTWVNELSSRMTLVQQGSALAGQYCSAVSGEDTATEGDLVGFVDGGLISFVVHWKSFQAITAWVGQLDPKSSQQTIRTLWQMTSQVEVGQEWASINAGADSFTRQ